MRRVTSSRQPKPSSTGQNTHTKKKLRKLHRKFIFWVATIQKKKTSMKSCTDRTVLHDHGIKLNRLQNWLPFLVPQILVPFFDYRALCVLVMCWKFLKQNPIRTHPDPDARSVKMIQIYISGLKKTQLPTTTTVKLQLLSDFLFLIFC